MEKLIESINTQYAAFSTNAQAFVEKGNKAAGVRARKAALQLAKALKEFRKESTAKAE